MGLYIIASVVEQKGTKSEILGYKVFNSSTCQYKLLSEDSIKKNIFDKGSVLENAVFKGKHLVGVNGNLQRYTALDVQTGEVVNDSIGVILGINKYGEYFVVLNPETEIVKLYRMSPFEVNRYVWQNRDKDIIYANARVIKDVDTFDKIRVMPISGSFNEIPVKYDYIEKVFDWSSKGWRALRVRLVKPGEECQDTMDKTNNYKVEIFNMNVNKSKFPLGQYLAGYTLNSDLLDILRDSNNFRVFSNSSMDCTLNAEMKTEILKWLEENIKKLKIKL